MNESVETFLGLAARYLEWATIVSLQLEVLGINRDATDPTLYTEAYFQAQHERNKARAAMLPAGQKLAAELEAGGHDSTGLLTFLHAADAGGGPPAAFPLWPSLKVQLQRILLQNGASADESKGEPAPLDDSVLKWPTSSQLDWPKHIDSDKKKREFLEAHKSEIPNEQRGQRRHVDANAFTQYWARQRKAAFESLGDEEEKPIMPLATNPQQVIEGMTAMFEQANAKKKRGQ